MNIVANLLMLAAFATILGETIYVSNQTQEGRKLSKEDFTTNVFVGTLIGLIFFTIGSTLYIYSNYNEQAVVIILVVTIAVSSYISLLSFGLSASRLRFATSS